MGCGSSTVQQPQQDAATREFDRIMEEEKIEAQLHFKLLTLGAGESGKSTIIKQLVFLHKPAPLSDEEKAAYVRVLHGNVLTCISVLLNEAKAFGYEFAEEHLPLVELVDGFDSRNLLTPEAADAIHTLWVASEAIARTYERRSEFWLLEGCEFFFANMHRFVEADYSPTEEDIVYARKRTTGVVETQLKYGSVHWSVVDVGGQRSERRKWLNCFDNVKGILYCVNLAGYCSVLFEDRSVNRMQESLSLFRETMANPLFAETPVFLVLNKKDLFERLIETRPLTMAFPEYTGPQELRACIEYIAGKFASVLPANRPRPMVLLMAARVKKDVQYCFEDVKDTLLDLNRKGIRRAQAKLDALREQFRHEQILEMERAAVEKARLLQIKQNEERQAAAMAARTAALYAGSQQEQQQQQQQQQPPAGAEKLPPAEVQVVGKESAVEAFIAPATPVGADEDDKRGNDSDSSAAAVPASACAHGDESRIAPATQHPTPSALPRQMSSDTDDGQAQAQAQAAARSSLADDGLVVQELSEQQPEDSHNNKRTADDSTRQTQQIEA